MNPYTSDRAVKLFDKIGWPTGVWCNAGMLCVRSGSEPHAKPNETLAIPICRSYLIDKLVAAGCHISIYPDETAISDAYADRVADNANLDLALIEAAEKVLVTK